MASFWLFQAYVQIFPVLKLASPPDQSRAMQLSSFFFSEKQIIRHTKLPLMPKLGGVVGGSRGKLVHGAVVATAKLPLLGP